MTMPTNSELWKSELWRRIHSETDVKVVAGNPGVTVGPSKNSFDYRGPCVD